MFISPWFNKPTGLKVKMDFRENIEPQEVLMDELARKREVEAGISEKKFETPLQKKILDGLFFFSLLLFFSLFIRTFQFQFIERERFSALAERNKYIIRQIEAGRGVIYDNQMKQLAFNTLSFDLVCQKNKLPSLLAEREKVFKEVGRLLSMNPKELEKKVEESQGQEVLILENLDRLNLIVLETKIEELPGFEIKNNTVRHYPQGLHFAHLIGYKRKTGEKIGLEQFYDNVLSEVPGEIRAQRDVHGNIISEEIVFLPESGQSLVLWLEADLQEKVVEVLEGVLKKMGQGGTVIALDPKTGGVLSLVSLPSFDNNLFSQGMSEQEWQKIQQNPNNPLLNRAISGRYLTGSTIKPLIAAAALEEKIISPEKQIYGSAFLEVFHRYNPEIVYKFGDWMTHGWVDMRKAIAQSCNIYFYTIGGGYKNQSGLGPIKIKEYLELFGWNEKTGIDLPGEAQGFLPDREWKSRVLGEGWWDGNTYYFSIGQEYIQITPMEVVTSFAAIANNGKLLKPQVVKEIVSASEDSLEVVKKFEPEIIRENFISLENLQVVREGMRQAVSGRNSPFASATLLNSLPVTSAAKTGTAELGGDIYHNWVTVFAPYENPEIVLTVMIEKVKGVQAAALPVAKEVLEWYFSR